MVVLLLLKFAAIVSLLPSGGWWLLVAPLLARALLLGLLVTTPYARPSGLGHPIAAHLPSLAALLWVVAAFLLLLVKTDAAHLALLAAVLLVASVMYRLALMRRLGGWTGDTAGALIELTETLLLVTVVTSG